MTPREYVSIRLSPDGLTAVRALAEQETEGNLSMMVRKLLTEAITARTITTPAERLASAGIVGTDADTALSRLRRCVTDPTRPVGADAARALAVLVHTHHH